MKYLFYLSCLCLVFTLMLSCGHFKKQSTLNDWQPNDREKSLLLPDDYYIQQYKRQKPAAQGRIWRCSFGVNYACILTPLEL